MDKHNEEHIYVAIDLKSFYASVECRERGKDALTTNLVVADPTRTEKTICLGGARRYVSMNSLSFKALHYKEELHKEKKRNSISEDRNLLSFSCKYLEYSICDKSKTYTMSDRS